MRMLSMVGKNFKLLVRSKSSAFIVFFGPLIIIALVGFLFSGKSSYDLSIGYHSEDDGNLTAGFVSALEQSRYSVARFGSEDECVDRIKEGALHTCILFPEGFGISNQRQGEVRFVVDYSRINLVYKVIDSVSGLLESESDEISYTLTSGLLSSINQTVESLSEMQQAEGEIAKGLDSAGDTLSASGRQLGEMKLDSSSLSLGVIRNHSEQLNDTLSVLNAKAFEVVEKGRLLVDELSGHIGSNESETLSVAYERLATDLSLMQNESGLRLEVVKRDIVTLDRELARLKSGLDESKRLQAGAMLSIDKARQELSSVGGSLGELEELTLVAKKRLEGIEISSAQTIASPVNTKIEPVIAESSNALSTFPFLVMLVVMFSSLLLSSTLSIYEKSSKASFRNFMAPVSPVFMLLSSFITVVAIIFFQGLIILSVSQAFLGVSLFTNPSATLLILLVSSFFFSSLGMLIGELISSQDGAVMSSLVFGSVFLFVSNLVVPLESLSGAVSWVIRLNPFIIFSELLRRSLLFSSSLPEMAAALLAMAMVSLGIFLLVSKVRNVSSIA